MIAWRLYLFYFIFIWIIVIWSLYNKLIISSWDNWIWSIDKYLIILKYQLFLLQILEYSSIRNLKKIFKYWLVDLFTLTQYFVNIEWWNWRTARFQYLDESITDIIWLILCCWLVYEQNWNFIYYFEELSQVAWMCRQLLNQINWIYLAVYNLNLGLFICCSPSQGSHHYYKIDWSLEIYQIWIQVKWKIILSIKYILKT